jgi:penicillin-binding protein A
VNTTIRKITFGLAIVFLALFVNLQYVQIAKSRDLANDPRNPRKLLADLEVKRGAILAADGAVLAYSVPTADKVFKYIRRYPLKGLFGGITGYSTSSISCGSAGLEETYGDYLTGRQPATSQNFVDDLLGRSRDGNLIKITIDPELQRLAAKMLGKQRGAVAAINPSTGAVLALYANPTYDPNVIAGRIGNECAPPKLKLESTPGNPLRFRAVQERYPPGSTFKIVTGTAGLESGMTLQTSFPNPSRLNLPDTDKTLRNFGGGSCAGGGFITLLHGFEVSCNTTFAQVAMRVGIKKFASVAERYGIDDSLNFDIDSVPSCMEAVPGGACQVPPDLSRPATAYSGIGQQDVRMTPLQMAVVGATVANGGRVPHPYLVQQILDPDGRVIKNTGPSLSRRIYSARTASNLRQMMINVVRFGTGTVVGFPRNITVGGKTGTAQTGISGQAPHVWFVAWSKGIAVAVVVENGGSLGSDATGGRVAGPIAKAVLLKVLANNRKRSA